jgi:hypothetical protein
MRAHNLVVQTKELRLTGVHVAMQSSIIHARCIDTAAEEGGLRGSDGGRTAHILIDDRRRVARAAVTDLALWRAVARQRIGG